MDISDILQCMAAKSDHNNKMLWLQFSVHSVDTANIIELLFNKWIPDSERSYLAGQLAISSDGDEAVARAANFCRLVALLHDIGKLTLNFQSKIMGNIEGHTDKLLMRGIDIKYCADGARSPHNVAGQAILCDYGFDSRISVIIGSHHGSVQKNAENNMDIYPENYFGTDENKSLWRSMWEEWITYSLRSTGFDTADELPTPDLKCQMLITGLLIMSDWIASNTHYFDLIDIDTLYIDEKESKARAETAWKRLGLPLPWCPDPIYNAEQMFEERFGFAPNNVQKTVMEVAGASCSAGIYILEAPMGVGKTEAALAFAEIAADRFGQGGIYFGLPTQATANGVFSRICIWAETQCDGDQHTIRLAHGMTDLNDEYRSLFRGKADDSEDEGLIVHEWFEGRKQALLADFVTATVDQFLLASLKQRHVMLRHLGLAGKVVIIDECHAYDAYMNVYLDKTLTWMGAYKVPVMILSATLPRKRRAQLVDAYLGRRSATDDVKETMYYPAITWTQGETVMQKAIIPDVRGKKVRVSRLAEKDIGRQLSDKLSDGGCAAVIVNDVAYAQELSRKLSEELEEMEVICFHSRFISTDRAETEKLLLRCVGKSSCMEDRDRLIVVGTQVIEQSLDLDFDYMITELCPMDLLLQRSGRLHRHDRARPKLLGSPELSILIPEEEKRYSVYSRWILDSTERYLPEYLDIPECIPELVDKVYKDPEPAAKSDPEWIRYCIEIEKKREKAKNYCIAAQLIKSRRVGLEDVLNDDKGEDRDAEASVRDSDETIEVIALRRFSDTKYALMPRQGNGAVLFTTAALSDDEAVAAARSRLRLPASFSKSYNFDATINDLCELPLRWRESKWLKGELLLLFNENMEAELCGKRVYYSHDYGLEVEKIIKEEEHGKRV